MLGKLLTATQEDFSRGSAAEGMWGVLARPKRQWAVARGASQKQKRSARDTANQQLRLVLTWQAAFEKGQDRAQVLRCEMNACSTPP